MKNIEKFISETIEECQGKFRKIDEIALFNQQKVLNAFIDCGIALRHFAGTSGYGYDDVGRDGLNKLFARVFNTEAAVVSPLISSGTHALTVALFGILRPGDAALSVSGRPYDTLQDVIFAKGNGSLADFGIGFETVNLTQDGDFDFRAIEERLMSENIKAVYVQRSRGYEWRKSFSVEKIGELCRFVKKIRPNMCVMIDNCYGEFVQAKEPSEAGADICAGSLIKNPGGGICPTGGYIVGAGKYIDLIAGRLTAPSVGCEIGSYAAGYRNFYQGLFLAPHTVAQAVKTAMLFSCAISKLGYEVLPCAEDDFYDIVCSVKFNDPDKLISFCQSIQTASPVDGFAVPEPWDMPGYSDKVIMAAGCFVQGSSIELSCDAPIRSPYIAYLQGGLTFEHGVIALKKALENL